MNARLNILCLVAAGLILALGNGDRTLVAVVVAAAIIVTLLVLALPRPRPATPRTITRLPSEHERQSRSKWLPGIFVHLPGIPFISLGLFRWRGRK